jgi:hypothetical protein
MALEERGGWGKSIHSTSAFCGGTPTPTLPREEREREHTSIVVIARPNMIMI